MRAPKVLVVEDNEIEAQMLEEMLTAFGYEVGIADNGRDALDLVRSDLYRLVVSDWEMPEMTGVELCKQLRSQPSGYVYVILLTARSGTKNVIEGLNAGADDFITKPVQPDELRVRVRTGERILALECHELIIFSLAKLAESRDPETGAHLERMREYCRLVAQQLSKNSKYKHLIDGQYTQLLYLSSPLHDIGKVGIPDRVLLKAGRLTKEEFDIMKQHTIIGGQTLDAALRAYPEAAFLRMARDLAWTHHEKFDGSGYPHGLAGENIPLCGRIAALADVYDALTTRRVYKEAYSHEVARSIIVDGSGKHFDPEIVDAFLAIEPQFIAVHDAFTSDDEESAFMKYAVMAEPTEGQLASQN